MNVPMGSTALPRLLDEWKTYWNDDGPRFIYIAEVTAAASLAMGLCTRLELRTPARSPAGADMTSQPNVRPVRERMVDDMRMRRLSPKTQANYLRIVREFSRYFGGSPATATVEDLRRYQLHLVDHGTSPVSLNAAITGPKFFFGITLHEPELTARMQPAREPRTRPVVLSPIKVSLTMVPPDL